MDQQVGRSLHRRCDAVPIVPFGYWDGAADDGVRRQGSGSRSAIGTALS